MKKILINSLLAISTLCIPLNFASAKCSYEMIRITGGDSLTIINLENAFGTAVINRDVAMLNKIISADFIYTENEKTYSREEMMQGFLSESEKIDNAYNEDMQVFVYDKTAIVTGWLYISGKGTNGEFKRKYRFTDVWLNKNGEWQIIAAQDYLLP